MNIFSPQVSFWMCSPGWRIDWEELQRRNGKDTAFAIPCPARRQAGNWVLEPVPLLDSRAARKRSLEDKAA